MILLKYVKGIYVDKIVKGKPYEKYIEVIL
jgi:hypothetical protein